MGSHAPSERGSLSGLLRHSLNYSLVPVLGRAVSVAMIPFYTVWLVRAEYGAAALADLLFAGLVQLLGANLLQGMQRFYFEHEELADRRAVISSCTLLLALVSWAVVGPLLMFSEPLSPLLIGSPSASVTRETLGIATAIALATVPFQLSAQAGFFHLMIRQASGLYAAISLVKLVFEVSLRIWFVGFLDLGLVGFLAPALISEALTTLLLTGWTLLHNGFVVRGDVLRPILRYTLPLIPVGVFQLLLHYGDQRLLEALAPDDGLDAVGVYAVGYKLGFLVSALLLDPFVRIFHPWIYAISDPREQGLRVARVGVYALSAISAASLLVMLGGKQALELFVSAENGYDVAWRVVPWITVGYVFWSVYHVSQLPLYIAKQTSPLVGLNAAALALNVLANLWLVPRYGFVGSGVATAITFAGLAAGGMVLARRRMAVPFDLSRLGLLAGLVLAGVFATLAVDGQQSWSTAAAVGVKLAIGLAGLAVVWRGALSAAERARALDRCRAFVIRR